MLMPMPSTNQDFALYCCELLQSAGPCVAKRMFGGWGISTGGLTIALMIDLGQGELLWLKADEDTRAVFEQAGGQRFTYDRKGVPQSMGYYTVPDAAMESPAEMARWAHLALDAALKAAKSKAPRAKSASKNVAKPSTKAAAKAGVKQLAKATTKATQQASAQTAAKPRFGAQRSFKP